MTQQELAQAIQALLDTAGYEMRLGIVLAKSKLDVTALVAEQFDFVPALQLVKRPEEQVAAAILDEAKAAT